MNCLRPVLLDNPDFGTDFDLYGSKYISVPCGHCEACIVNNANEWRVRLEIENEHSSSSFFITLTYDDEHLPIQSVTDYQGNPIVVPSVSKRDIQLFLKRLRKRFPEQHLVYFIVSEYGPSTLRPHYHGIIFNLPLESDNMLLCQSHLGDEICKCWNLGHIKLDTVTSGRISYVTKYMSCITEVPSYYPKPFRLMSRRPAIGSSYLANHSLVNWHRENLACYYPDMNFKKRLPRYLKDKIFDDAMKLEIREQIQKIKQNEQINNLVSARTGGYSRIGDYKCDQQQKFIRKFNKQLTKKRKDI